MVEVTLILNLSSADKTVSLEEVSKVIVTVIPRNPGVRSPMVDNEAKKQALDHAWKYFELHAAQRLSMFNFFVAFSTVALAGLGASIQGGRNFEFAGLLIGAIIPVITFVFWHLERRTAFLVKHGEQAIVALERELLPAGARIFGSEPVASDPLRLSQNRWWKRHRSYREGFETIFIIVACIGIFGAAFSGYQLAEMRWPKCECSKASNSQERLPANRR
jgi:hypothetical protein